MKQYEVSLSQMKNDIVQFGQLIYFPTDQTLGCSSVILLRPKMGVESPKHDVISMPTQEYTNTNYISLERYHLVVSIMLRYMDQFKTFNDNLSCREVKIDKNFWGDLPYFALKCDKFL